MKNRNIIINLALICGFMFMQILSLSAQDSTVVNSATRKQYASLAFWGTRVLNGHSLETTLKGKLDFRIQHRLGRLDGGFNELFGLDQASVRLGLEYGILDWLMVGTGRSTMDKYYNGFVKAKILRQSKGGKRNMPISLTAMADIGIESGKFSNPDRKNYFSSRLYYTYQLIIGGYYWNRVGVQIAPTLIHRNLVTTTRDHNDVYSLGFGGRVRISNVVALSAEYYYVIPGQVVSLVNGSKIRNNFSLGVEIYTGKHIFQIFLTNATGSNEKQFITENTENWLDKGIHIGFNLTRLFTVANY
jgi:hypothetical protein